jgi:hypothetical protein
MEYADYHKKILLRWLLPQLSEDEVMRMELPFDNVAARADIAIVGRRRLAAIEIKGPRDNTKRLAEQIRKYSEMFLECWVAADPKHLSAIRRIVPRAVGLISLPMDDLESPQVVRKASLRDKLQRSIAAKWLRREELVSFAAKAISAVTDRRDIESLRMFVADNAQAEELSQFALTTLTDRCRPIFEAFLNERGTAITLDDVKVLSLHQLRTARLM